MLILRKPWNSQPQDIVSVASEYSARVTSAAIGHVSPTESGNYAFPRAVTRAGVGVDPTTTAGRYSICPPTGTADFALVAVVVPATVAGFTMLASRDDSGTGGTARVFQLRTNGTGVDFIRFNSAVSAFTASAAGVLAVGRPAVVVASSRGADVRVWVDGVAGTATMTGTPQTWPASAGSASRWFERLSNATDVDHGAHASLLRVVIKGGLSDAEGLELSRDPWQLFEPRRIIIPAAAVGAGNTVAVPAGSLTLTGFAPTVAATANQVVEVPAGTLTLAGQTPTATSSDHQTISVPAGTLTLTANAPTVAATENQSISVPAGTLTLAGQTPTVTASDNQTVAVPLGTLTLTGFAPNVLNGAQQVVQVPLGTLTLTGQTPTVAVSANQVIAVPAGTLTLAGQTPTVVATNPQLISVPLGTLTLTGLVPTISNVGVNNQISVPLGTLTMSGYTPIVRVSTDADVFLDRFAARSRITQSAHFGSRITTQVGLRSSLKD